MSFADIRRAALAHEQAMLAATHGEFVQWGHDAIAQARQDAPWPDETGAARDGLAVVLLDPQSLMDGGRLALVHGVDYGLYLELAHGGRYAIIMPTVATMGPQLMARLRRIWK